MLRTEDGRAELAVRRREVFQTELRGVGTEWLATVTAMRPGASWRDVAAALNKKGGAWTDTRLARLSKWCVGEGLAPLRILERQKEPVKDGDLLAVAAAVFHAGARTLREIARGLEGYGVQPPRGGGSWQPSSVKALMGRVRCAGLLRRPVGSQQGEGRSARDRLTGLQPARCTAAMEGASGEGSGETLGRDSV